MAVEDEPGCVEREIMCSKNEAALVCSTYLIETGLNNGPFLIFSCFTIEGISASAHLSFRLTFTTGWNHKSSFFIRGRVNFL